MGDELREQAVEMIRDALQFYGAMVQDSRSTLPVAEDVEAGRLELHVIDAVGNSKLFHLSITELE